MRETWEMTRLWELVRERTTETDAARLTLLNCMPKIELVLSAGGTAIPDFTLHDHEHAFRVAERMYDLLPEDVVSHISTFELTLLILAAYLHDIGMSPRREVVRRHYQ